MKYSCSAITQLTRWYRQILIKCAIFNAAIMVGAFGMPIIAGATEINQNGVPLDTMKKVFKDNAVSEDILSSAFTL